MSIVRASIIGGIVWVVVFCLFTLLSFIAITKDSQTLQAAIVGMCIVPLAYFGAKAYYKNGNTGNGLVIGLIMVTIALILDALITVPLVEIPYNGGDYLSFFSSTILWILVAINVGVIYSYWKVNIKEIYHL